MSGPAAVAVPSAALVAVVVACVAPEEASTLVRATAKDALRAMVPSTMLGVLTDRAAVLRGCARAVIGRPTYLLRSGLDVDAVPDLVARALRQAL